MLNAAPASEAVLPLLPLTDILVVNEGELELLGRGLSDPDHGDMTAALAHLGPSLPRIVIVTLGAKGLAIVRDGAVRHTPGWPAKVVDTTGAGDCFCGYLAAGLARGDSLESAASEANFAASIAVQSLGAANSIPSRSAIITAYCEGP
jgi:ribokinase